MATGAFHQTSPQPANFAQAKTEYITPSTISTDALIFLGGKLFGSRALGVNAQYADYDIAILKETFDIYIQDKEVISFNKGVIDTYFEVIPPYGTNVILLHVAVDTGHTADILLFEYKTHVEAVASAVEAIKDLPVYELQGKANRIALYQQALLDEGWVHKDHKARAKYIPERMLRWTVKNSKSLLTVLGTR